MHEVGIMIEVIRNVENFARINRLTKIDTLVLQIGELSSVIPRYIEACYPAAVDGTLLQDTKLKIEILPGNAICKKCNKVFNLIESNNKCPNCVSKDWEILCGKEFMIKEIVAC
ncbi:hydrogenase maturation nickel metallochaperone HypA [Clostridium sp. LCP25S3_F10]|uniref:hydrogenase maturation nickel metallochaperone HypA n=1 Tax=Clostridium sp. LCP25S3_F10 TaxID=3438750 RepID=UPI003F929705